jgi:hypothetical protein
MTTGRVKACYKDIAKGVIVSTRVAIASTHIAIASTHIAIVNNRFVPQLKRFDDAYFLPQRHKGHKGFTKNCRAPALCALCAFVVKNDKKAVKK